MRHPSSNEQKAAEYGRDLDKLIIDIMNSSSVKYLSSANINQLIISINTLLNDQGQNIDGPYFNFLVQQCRRFNSFLQIYQSEDGSYTEQYGNLPVQLHAVEFEDIITPPRSITVSIEAEPGRFTNPIVVKRDAITEYYYDQEQVEGFKESYHLANVTIGKQTQQSNLAHKGKFAPKKVATLFLPESPGQAKDDYFHPTSYDAHARSKKSFTHFIKCIEAGKPVSEDVYRAHWEGHDPYYVMPNLMTPHAHAHITHVGHATALYQAGSFTVVCDPVHYQSGTEGIIAVGAALAYPRHTEPAFAANRYPGTTVVWISHNHHDHLCPRTLKQAFSKHTLFIVPIGDKRHLNQWGFNNVIEIPDWCTSVTLNDNLGETLTLHALPAKHASNRKYGSDYMQSLYMGTLIEHQSRNSHTMTLVTGDTAVLDEAHYQQLEAFIRQRNIPISLACIAAGPDRPRQFMECTHQSSADAMALHARLIVANSKLANEPLTLEGLKALSCRTIAYHQGCYRLGLLSYNDAKLTFLRILTCLDSIKKMHAGDDVSLDALSEYFAEAKQHNVSYAMMDEFERQGLQAIIDQFKQIEINGQVLGIANTITLLLSTYCLPHMGSQSHDLPFSNHIQTNELMTNKKAEAGFTTLTNELLDSHDEGSILHHAILTAYLAYTDISRSSNKIDIISNWLQKKCITFSNQFNRAASRREQQSIMNGALCDLYHSVIGDKTCDNTLREAGNFETMMLALLQAVDTICVEPSARPSYH